jgi:hypothetical protein
MAQWSLGADEHWVMWMIFIFPKFFLETQYLEYKKNTLYLNQSWTNIDIWNI